MDERGSSTPNEDCWDRTHGNFCKCDQALFPFLGGAWGHVVTPVLVDICLVCRWCENLTMGVGKYCLGRAPNSNVLYTIVRTDGTRRCRCQVVLFVQYKTTVLWRVSLNYRACEEYVLSNFELYLVLLLLSWWANLIAFHRVTSCVQHLFMHFAPQIHTLQRATALSSSSSVAKECPVWLNVVVYAGIQYPTHELEHKLTFLSDTTN